jgi:hypothetical protein
LKCISNVVSLSTPNIIANIRQVRVQYECAVRAMRKKLKLSSNGGELGSKKLKWGYGGVCDGVWRSLRLAGIWNQAVGIVLVRLASRREDVFTFNLLHKDIL